MAYQDIQNSLLVDYGEQSPHFRWLCTFKGSPYLFMEGIDTDEILTYKPDTFKMLRAFWKVSFIKLGDEENNSLKEIFLLRRQQEALTHQGIFQTADETHARMLSKPLEEYVIKPAALLQSCNTGTRLRHEMALEAWQYSNSRELGLCLPSGNCIAFQAHRLYGQNRCLCNEISP